MFSGRSLPSDLEALRDDIAPEVLVVDAEQEFESLSNDALFELALFTDDINATDYPSAWIPEDAPDALQALSREDPVIGLPGDGGVTWTRQTSPPLVIVKPRLRTAGDDFIDFLISEALLELASDLPETPIAFFTSEYSSFQSAVGGDPDLTYRLAVALTTAWCGLQTRKTFDSWQSTYPRLFETWADSGEKLRERVSNLPQLLASGQLGFGEGTELACSAIKHDLPLPTPYSALAVAAYRDHGPAYAITWVERTLEQLNSVS